MLSHTFCCGYFIALCSFMFFTQATSARETSLQQQAVPVEVAPAPEEHDEEEEEEVTQGLI